MDASILMLSWTQFSSKSDCGVTTSKCKFEDMTVGVLSDHVPERIKGRFATGKPVVIRNWNNRDEA